MGSRPELRFGAFPFWYTVFVFGVVLDQVIVGQHPITVFLGLHVWAYRFRVWRSVGSGDCWAQHPRTPFRDLHVLAYRFRVWRSVGSGDCWAASHDSVLGPPHFGIPFLCLA